MYIHVYIYMSTNHRDADCFSYLIEVLGTLFLWVGWFGFNAGSLGAIHNGCLAALWGIGCQRAACGIEKSLMVVNGRDWS